MVGQNNQIITWEYFVGVYCLNIKTYSWHGRTGNMLTWTFSELEQGAMFGSQAKRVAGLTGDPRQTLPC